MSIDYIARPIGPITIPPPVHISGRYRKKQTGRLGQEGIMVEGAARLRIAGRCESLKDCVNERPTKQVVRASGAKP